MPIDKTLLARIQANDPKLTWVEIRYSQLTLAELKKLVEALKHNTHVKRLDVSGNPIGNEGLALLAAPNFSFTSLVAAECQITAINILAKNERLTKLFLPSNRINATGLSLFLQNKTLKVLSLAGNDLTDESAEVLAKNATLSSLILSHNKVGVRGAQAFSVNQTLERLNLNYNVVQVEGAVALAKNTHLTSLMLAGNEMTALGASAFVVNKHLTELDVSYNHINDEGAIALAKHPTLTRLDLGYNQITFEGANALSQMAQLVSLTICHNLLRDPGVAALAQIKGLQHLDVAGNGVGVDGAHALALNTSLKSLVLSTNVVGDVGAVLLANNRHLSKLFLSYNNIGDAGATALAGNKTLKALNLNYNRISEKGRQVLLQNKTLSSLILSQEQPPEFTEENLSTIFLLCESFLCITDIKGNIEFFNPAFSRILGYADDELLTQSYFNFFHAENKPSLETRLSKFEKPVPQRFESRYQCRDGAFRTIRWAVHSKNNRLYIMGIDITEQRSAENEYLLAQQSIILNRLQESEAYVLRQTQFIAQLSHEIRNPLSGIYGLTEALKIEINDLELLIKALYSLPSLPEQTKLDQTFLEIRETCADMLGCMEYQKAILNDNLDVVRITENRLTLQACPFELKKALQEVLKMFQAKAAQKGVALHIEMPGQKEVWVKSDPLRFKQIIVNLIGNAIKFTDSGGKIDLILILQESSAHEVAVKIVVVDTGLGMTEEELGLLFQRFSQSTGSHYEGSGLGLYLAKQLAVLMQGDITVKSTKGKGSTFSFDVHFASVLAEEKKSPQKSQLSMFSLEKKAVNKLTDKRTALIVDDNLINQKILTRLLTVEGYDCRVANDGIEALAAYDSSPVNVILMDIVMPRMDGLTATREIRRREFARGLPRTPIIAVTANALECDQKEGFAAGVDDYSIKPFKKVEICEKIDALIQVTQLENRWPARSLHGPLSSLLPTTKSPPSAFSLSSSMSLVQIKRKKEGPIDLYEKQKKQKKQEKKKKEAMSNLPQSLKEKEEIPFKKQELEKSLTSHTLPSSSGTSLSTVLEPLPSSATAFGSSSGPHPPLKMDTTRLLERKKGSDEIEKPVMSPPTKHAPYAEFFSPSPPDEKMQLLRLKVHAVLDQAYPFSATEYRDTRKAYLLQLKEYQSDASALNQLLIVLQARAAQPPMYEWFAGDGLYSGVPWMEAGTELTASSLKTSPTSEKDKLVQPLAVFKSSLVLSDNFSSIMPITPASFSQSILRTSTSAPMTNRNPEKNVTILPSIPGIGFWEAAADFKSWLQPHRTLQCGQGLVCLVQPKTSGVTTLQLYTETLNAKRKHIIYAYTLTHEEGVLKYQQAEVRDKTKLSTLDLTHALSAHTTTNSQNKAAQHYLTEHQDETIGPTCCTKSGEVNWSAWYQRMLIDTGIIAVDHKVRKLRPAATLLLK